MRFKYKKVEIRTVKDVRRAEWYKAHGWKIISVNPISIMFEKEIK
jgi:very-short-patch-repair endonuclease